jgi:hypothetical protein
MTRTTPPRPVDIAAEFPELAKLSRIATRLHPRQGTPSPQDSSIGGPLLWPIDETWPYCEGPHYPFAFPLITLANVRRLRAPLAAAYEPLLRGRFAAAYVLPEQPDQFGPYTVEEQIMIGNIRYGLSRTAKEQAVIDGWTYEPIAMIPVAQLYARDIPNLHPPEGCDLLQVLWCPFDHPEEVMPKAKLIWRSSSTVSAVLSSPPQPVAVQLDDYVPKPCVIHPERVIEYPALLDEGLRQRVKEWEERERSKAGRANYHYFSDLSVAPGWKVGGWAPLSFRDILSVSCTTCGIEMEPLLTIATSEWDGSTGSWIPSEDQALAADSSKVGPGVQIGRGYNMQIYRCPVSVDHPHAEWMQ